jgi:hypothetical protein
MDLKCSCVKMACHECKKRNGAGRLYPVPQYLRPDEVASPTPAPTQTPAPTPTPIPIRHHYWQGEYAKDFCAADTDEVGVLTHSLGVKSVFTLGGDASPAAASCALSAVETDDHSPHRCEPAWTN